MTENEFFREALLKIAGNSAFGNDYNGSYYSMSGWAKRIEEAANALLDVAEKNYCLDDGE